MQSSRQKSNAPRASGHALWHQLHSALKRSISGRVSMSTMALDERHESSMMEELPAEVLTHVLGFMDIPARVKLARCNTTLQRRVYQECQQATMTFRVSKESTSSSSRTASYVGCSRECMLTLSQRN